MNNDRLELIMLIKDGQRPLSDLVTMVGDHKKALTVYAEAIQISQVITSQYGIDNMDDFMSSRYSKELDFEFPFEKGDELFRTWVSVGVLDGQVRNGGFSQYFVNDFGYQFPDAIAAFDRIGEKKVCEILIPFRNSFDKVEPVGDYSATKLQKVFDRIDGLLDESNGAYYAVSEHACAKRDLYLLEKIKAERAGDD